MAYNSPFQPQGNTVSLTTSGTASTSQSRQVTAANFGVQNFPQSVRIANPGSAIVWISFTLATATLTIPTAGTTTAGTPQPCFPLLPGVVEVFTLPAGPVVFVNDISTGTSQTYHITAGEGM